MTGAPPIRDEQKPPVVTNSKPNRWLRAVKRRGRAVFRRLLNIGTEGPRGTRQLEATVKRHWIRGSLDDAQSVVQAYINRRAEPKPAAFDLFCAILREKGEEEAAYRCALTAAEQHQRFFKTAIHRRNPKRTLDVTSRIFLSGYFYSGSGAVVDYLRGFSGCHKWPVPSGELRLIKFPGGLADLQKRLKASGELTLLDAVDLYLHLVGRRLVDAAPGRYNMWNVVNRNSRKLVRDPRTHLYLEEGFELFKQVAALAGRSAGTHDAFGEVARSGVARMLDAAATSLDSERLVVDQGITAWRLPIAELVPPSSFIVVHRDPRDQYVEAQAAHLGSGRKGWDPEAFCTMYEKRRRIAERAIPRLKKRYGHRVLRLAFEDFVTDHDRTAARVREFLDLEKLGQTEKRFYPEKSIANVGKCRGLLPEAERQFLEKRLHPYLHHAV